MEQNLTDSGVTIFTDIISGLKREKCINDNVQSLIDLMR